MADVREQGGNGNNDYQLPGIGELGDQLHHLDLDGMLEYDPIIGDGYGEFATARRRIENETLRLQQAQYRRLYLAEETRLLVASVVNDQSFSQETRDRARQFADNYDVTESVNHFVERIRATSNVALTQNMLRYYTARVNDLARVADEDDGNDPYARQLEQAKAGMKRYQELAGQASLHSARLTVNAMRGDAMFSNEICYTFSLLLLLLFLFSFFFFFLFLFSFSFLQIQHKHWGEPQVGTDAWRTCDEILPPSRTSDQSSSMAFTSFSFTPIKISPTMP
jgi:hypothetical protein